MNYGPRYEHRVTLRLTDKQYNWLIGISELLGVSPSDYMRMCINATMTAMDDKIFKEVGTDENVKTCIDDIV